MGLLSMLGAEHAAASITVPQGRGLPGTGSVIFLHPDGTSLTAWNAYRLLTYGPDGLSEWDRMPQVAFYRPHVTDSDAITFPCTWTTPTSSP